MQIGDELARLFNLQGEPFGDRKQSAFVDELAECGIPFGAIIAGIRALVKENLTKIKITTILDAAHRHVAPGELGDACQECHDGIILAKDPERREYALACHCSRGQARNVSGRLITWNGSEAQESRGRTLLVIPKIKTSSAVPEFSR